MQAYKEQSTDDRSDGHDGNACSRTTSLCTDRQRRACITNSWHTNQQAKAIFLALMNYGH